MQNNDTLMRDMFGEGYDDDNGGNDEQNNINMFFSCRDKARKDKCVSDNGFVVGDNNEELEEGEESGEGQGQEDGEEVRSQNNGHCMQDDNEMENLVRTSRGLALTNSKVMSNVSQIPQQMVRQDSTSTRSFQSPLSSIALPS